MTNQPNWNPQQYARDAAFVPELGSPVVDLLAPKPGERILDLGCGDGTLTLKLIASGATVLGVDANPQMIASAKAKGIDAHVADAHALTFTNEFDAVFSNAALHWMLNPDAVIARVWRALKPGGRFVAEFGGKGNVALLDSTIRRVLTARGIDVSDIKPLYYPGVEGYRGKLESRGFTVTYITIFERPTDLPGDVVDWYKLFRENFLARIPQAILNETLDELRQTLAPKLRRADGSWWADYVRLRFVANKALI